ncbi:L-seryl-tRNA(Sec) selenium transferase [Hydrogenivirga caldilitoris]|uniref:L-seryl-tRNA(Sec) selenium transferase n=1 Tax=Hydrogenivirga caldilitoris TaxID=246264 RepID=A0A497XQ71_9AQUI|nr:L-seryl-tRNA(Sec) selenium transferase [Hydrogenivirga caldilitoris]RLJ71115.1 L-seryl-tRNA(Sec) selenium transferase [Hydrogenivirga caldilitoris]
MDKLLREIPQVAKIIERFKGVYPEEVIKRAAREVTQEYRREIRNGLRDRTDTLLGDVEKRIRALLSTNLRKVVNATGIVINTNLGRAPLHREALEFVKEIGEGYSNLEYDLKKGERGSRNSHVEGILCELTGAEAALVVNNNAGAVYLVLNTLAAGKEVVVSRGELVEIGGSFRIPDIMKASGAVLREVGTTNKTKTRDYEEAISENTALLMKVHRSNFYMEGFVQEVNLEELSQLGKKYGVPTYYDAGSGLLINIREMGINSQEPSFGECLRKGIDVVSGSGDKLLGGPQAGIILGRRELLEKVKRNPMARALRIDKLTLAVLEKSLRLYLEGRYREIPVIRMLSQTEKELRGRARKLARMLRKLEVFETEVLKDMAKPGGGSIPEVELPTYCVAVKQKGMNPEELARRLRLCEPPVVGRIKRDVLLLDMRTVSDTELTDILRAFTSLL